MSAPEIIKEVKGEIRISGKYDDFRDGYVKAIRWLEQGKDPKFTPGYMEATNALMTAGPPLDPEPLGALVAVSTYHGKFPGLEYV